MRAEKFLWILVIIIVVLAAMLFFANSATNGSLLCGRVYGGSCVEECTSSKVSSFVSVCPVDMACCKE